MAWPVLARTYRTTVVALARAPDPIRLRHGIRLLPARKGQAVDRLEPLPGPDLPAARALDAALASIETTHGAATADLVALQIESPGHRPRPRH